MDNLSITGYPTEDDIIGSDEEQISIIINNFKNHPSIIDINENIQINEHFSFAKMNKEDVTIIKLMDVNKPTTYNNIPPKMLVENSDICSTQISIIYNDSVFNHMFPNAFKMQISHLPTKKTKLPRKTTIDLLVYSLLFPKFLKDKCTTKFAHTCTNISHPFFMASGRVIVRNNT